MRKYLAIAAATAIIGICSIAYAAEVTVGGEVNIRSRSFQNLDLDRNVVTPGDSFTITQERVLVEVNAKSDGVKGKIGVWNDFDSWGRFEAPQGNGQTTPEWSDPITKPTPNDGRIAIREAWIDFTVPDTPIGVKAGHQLMQLGPGWFFRANYMGSDMWVVYSPIGKATVALTDVKISEGLPADADDVDAYMGIAEYKLDQLTAGLNVTVLNDRAGKAAQGLKLSTTATDFDLTNLGLNLSGKAGSVNLKIEVDLQDGRAHNGAGAGTDLKFRGNQVVIEGNLPIEPVTINLTLARGSGNKAGETTKHDQMVTFLDATQHYTLLYEYPGKLKTAAGSTGTGFANTTAASAGVMVRLAKSIEVGGDLWYFRATEKTNVNGGPLSNSVGTELDLKANWKLYENLSWNWTAGYFSPGSVYRDATGGHMSAAKAIQGYLAFKF